MADDLNFSHNVEEIPQGQPLPKPYQRQVSVQPNGVPDYEGGVTNYAANTNWMSAVGSEVASKASNALAEKIGGELGKNPKGNLGIPLTTFDKTMQQSYNTQAQATLGLQADKLITDSNIAAASANRMSPDIIKNAQNNITAGLQKIIALAPDQVKPELTHVYGTAQLSQVEHLTNRMLNEQHEDRKNNTILANDKNAEMAHSLAASGKFDAADTLVKSTVAMNASTVNANVGFTPQAGKVSTDTVRQSAIAGRLQFNYDNAVKISQGDAYLASLAKKPDWISDADYPTAVDSLKTYVNNQKALTANYEGLTISDFKNRMVTGIGSITGTELQSTLDKLSPDNASKLQLDYSNAYKTYQKDSQNQNFLAQNWGSPVAHANASAQDTNKTFNGKVAYVMQSSPGISRDDAEVQVAVAAGGKVPVFEKTLENKLVKGSPESILSGVNQIDLLNKLEAGSAYDGISQKAKAIATLFSQQRGSMPDSDLARKITDNLSNVDKTMQDTLNNAWNLELSNRGAAGLAASSNFYSFALNEVGLDKNKLGGNYFAVIYGNDLYNQLNSNFIATRGDYNAAVTMTKDYYNQHYGETYVNGISQITDSPVEKYLGYKGKEAAEAAPFVQQDLLNQLTPAFEKAKKDFPSDYWETLPLKNGVAEVMRTVMTKDGKKQYTYPVELLGRAGNQWDVVVKTPNAIHNLFLVAPHVGVTSYQPNKAEIDKNFQANTQKYVGITKYW